MGEQVLVSRELAAVVTAAVRLAGSRSSSRIGTEHLVASLGQVNLAWRRALPARSGVVRRALRESADRGGDTRAATPEESRELDGLLREAHWLDRGIAGTGPQWTNMLRATLRSALAIAASAGRPLAGTADLAAALQTERRSGAYVLFGSRGDDAATRLGELATLAEPEHPWAPAVRALRFYGIVGPAPAFGRLLRAVGLARDAFFAIEHEAIRQAVRLGARQVTGAHLVLAVLSIDDQLRRTDQPETLGFAAARTVCGEHGLTQVGLLTEAERLATSPQPTAPEHRGRSWRTNPRNPSWTVDAAAAADQAHRRSEAAGLAILRSTVDADGVAQQLIRAAGGEPAALLSP